MKGFINAGHRIIASIVILFTLFVVFIPQIEFNFNIEDYLVHFLMLLIFSGIVGLIISNKIVLYTSFGCAAILALFLKNASNSQLKNPKENKTENITVAHINLSLVTEVETVTKIMNDSLIDVISFQEYTPDWANIIPLLLKNQFPHDYQNVRIDFFGKAIFARRPLYEQKIIQLTDIPELETKLLLGQDTVSVISTFFTPALDSKSKQAARIQFENMSEYILNSKHLQIVMGEFNQVYWSHDILSFRTKTGLQNSRRSVYPTTLKMPYDHIFYTNDLECFQFEELSDATGEHIGCKASFQYKRKRAR